MGERLRIAAENDIDVTKVAVDPDALRRDDEEIGRRRPLLLGAVLGIGADVDDFLRPTVLVDLCAARRQKVIEVADDRAQVLAGRDSAPAADGVESHGDRPVRKERRRLVGRHLVGMRHAENHEGLPFRRRSTVGPGTLARGVLVRADDVLRSEIPRPEAIDAVEQPRHPVQSQFRESAYDRMPVQLERLVQRRPRVAPHGVVARHRLVGPLDDDRVALAGQRFDDRSFGEGPEDVEVDRPHLRATCLPQVVDDRFAVLGGGAERHENRVGIVRLILRDQIVVAASQAAEFLVSLLEELQDRLDEVVAPGDHALHVVFLILHRPEEHRIRQVDHLRHATARRAKQRALRLGRTLDDVLRRTKKLPEKLGLMAVEGALEVRGQETVLDVHPRCEAEFVDLAQDQRLVGRLLGVLGEQDGPADVERPVDVVVPAMHVQRMLGERSCHDLDHHGRRLARSVVVLLNPVDDALARGEVDHASPAHRVGDGAALGGVLAFGFDGQSALAEYVQPSLREGLLVELATFGRRSNRIKDPRVSNSRFRVVRNQLVAVCRDAFTWILGTCTHDLLSKHTPDHPATRRGRKIAIIKVTARSPAAPSPICIIARPEPRGNLRLGEVDCVRGIQRSRH